MTWDDVVDKAKAYLNEHEYDDDVDIMDYVRELNHRFDVDLPYPGYHKMSELDDVLGDYDPLEIMRMAVKGDDEYSYTFDLDRDYFYVGDALHSVRDLDVDSSEYIDNEEFITALYEYRDDLTLPKYLVKLFNAYDEEDTDEEDEE